MKSGLESEESLITSWAKLVFGIQPGTWYFAKFTLHFNLSQGHVLHTSQILKQFLKLYIRGAKLKSKLSRVQLIKHHGVYGSLDY